MMDFNEYQGLARRTQNSRLTEHERIMHALHGLSAEVGEIHGLYQHIYQGGRLITEEVVGELGDLLWFAGELCDVLRISMDDVAEKNIRKLRRRYPQGFDAERSEKRHEVDGGAQ